MGTKGSFQLRLISFPLPEAEKISCLQNLCRGAKSSFQAWFWCRKDGQQPTGAELRPASREDLGGRDLVCVLQLCCAESLLLSEKSVFPIAVGGERRGCWNKGMAFFSVCHPGSATDVVFAI